MRPATGIRVLRQVQGRKGTKMPGKPSTGLAKPKWRNRWYQASFVGLLILCALSDTALALTGLPAANNGNWGGIAMLVLAALFISVAYPMFALRTGDILYPPEDAHPISENCGSHQEAAQPGEAPQ